jgi:ubiquitin-conjugating enzyme E2 L3
MAATRRLTKEFQEIIANKDNKIFSVELASDSNLLNWTGEILPPDEPYKDGAFNIEINFPAEYPFKPPKIVFKTAIYHPNVDEKGQICLPLISPENWKPATKVEQILQALVALILKPEPEHPLRGDIAEEYMKNKDLFLRRAKEHTLKNAKKK